VTLEDELRRLMDDLLGDCLDQMETHSVAAAKAEAAYKVKHAKALLASTFKTVADREADAIVKCEAELFARLVEDRAVTTQREKLSAYRTSIDGIRTLMVGLRENIR
jgi:hypothetical protein